MSQGNNQPHHNHLEISLFALLYSFWQAGNYFAERFNNVDPTEFSRDSEDSLEPGSEESEQQAHIPNLIEIQAQGQITIFETPQSIPFNTNNAVQTQQSFYLNTPQTPGTWIESEEEDSNEDRINELANPTGTPNAGSSSLLESSPLKLTNLAGKATETNAFLNEA